MNGVLRILIPRIAALVAALIVLWVPSLKDAEEAVVSAILAVWGVIEIATAKQRADRQERTKESQRVLRAEGVYLGKIDGQHGPKMEAAVKALAGKAPHRGN